MRKEINTQRAIELRELGVSWPEIGRRLAKEDRRQMPYDPKSVVASIKRWKKGNPDATGKVS